MNINKLLTITWLPGKLGQGSFGSVWAAESDETQRQARPPPIY